MSRFSRNRNFPTPLSKLVISVVAVAVTVGAALELRRARDNATVARSTPPLQMSVASSAGNAVTLQQASPSPLQVIKPVTASVPQPMPLITRTPDPTKVPVVAQQPPVTNSIAAAAAKTDPAPPVNSATLASSVTAGSSTAAPAGVVSDATARATADPLAARQLLNSALLSGKLSAADTAATKKQLSDLNQTIIFSPKHFPKDPLGGDYVVKSGDRLSTIGTAHNVPYELLMQLNRMSDPKKLRYGQSLKIINGPFSVVITKSKFTMDVYLGSPGGSDSTYITTYAVGLGTDNSTPTGTWSIKNKVMHPVYFPPESHAGAVLEADDPKNPLGTCWMGLEGTEGQAVGQQSYGIHGTIDPNSIGKQSSMGCIRLKNEDVEMVYKMLMQGKSTVVVRD